MLVQWKFACSWKSRKRVKVEGVNCRKFVAQGIADLGLAVDNAQQGDLCRYYQELEKWGRKMNLVAKGSMAEVLALHFLDSLTLLPHLPQEPFSLLDVGTGAGFPGLVLKAVRPDMALTMVEPRGKRVTFLRHVSRTLQLDGVEIIAKRLEADNQHGLGSFDVITSRAFTNLADFLPLVESYLAPSGEIICMKGPKAEEELAQWQQLTNQTSLQLIASHPVAIPTLDKHHQLVIFSTCSN